MMVPGVQAGPKAFELTLESWLDDGSIVAVGFR